MPVLTPMIPKSRLPRMIMVGCFFLSAAAWFTIAAEQSQNPNDARARRFVEYYDANIRPLVVEVNRRDWTANITGRKEDFAKKQAAEDKLDQALADAERFAELKIIRRQGVSDPLLARQLDILYLESLGRQVSPELLAKLSAKSNAVQRTFNVFRPRIGDREMTDNEIRKILATSRDSAERRAAWEASKQIGAQVVGDLKELVALRNEQARELGFSDYFAMRLHLSELDEQQLFQLFDELDELTREPFHTAKAELDASLAASYGIAPEKLRPWHYQDPFFQEAPVLDDSLPTAIFQSLDIADQCRRFYDGIGLPVDAILRRSSLYEKPGKNPHAFATDIDRDGDVRILENVVPNEEWLSTTLHELGHAVYSENIDRRLPFTLRNDAHALCTEGVAMMFDDFAHNVDWLLAMGIEVPEPDRYRVSAAKLASYRKLIFARFCQVMLRFERELYRNPNQDLNRLWWDLVEKYQEVNRPEGRNEPDYAAKYHILGAPAYYHNYMMGEMFASQLHHAMIRALQPETKPEAVAGAIYVGNRDAGKLLRERVFAPGLSMNWNQLTRHATGKDLSAKAFAEDIEIAK